jgi:hypothetical protein
VTTWGGRNVDEYADELTMVLAIAHRRMDQLGYPPAPPPTVDGRDVGD